MNDDVTIHIHSGVSLRKNPHAVALGRLGGSVASPAQRAAARRNGRKSPGRPRKYPIELTGAERTHLFNIKQQGGKPRTPAQFAVVAKIEAGRAAEKEQ